SWSRIPSAFKTCLGSRNPFAKLLNRATIVNYRVLGEVIDIAHLVLETSHLTYHIKPTTSGRFPKLFPANGAHHAAHENQRRSAFFHRLPQRAPGGTVEAQLQGQESSRDCGQYQPMLHLTSGVLADGFAQARLRHEQRNHQGDHADSC